ncbi:NYN domain-containing protein [Candidatus Peregrinibacteria bacterium]|nr:NYN domain-containing protein [Candidatus Peregrinibacteria bacterium]
MSPHHYNSNAKPTALLPETVRRQSFFTPGTSSKKAAVFIDGSNWYHKLKKLLAVPQPGDIRSMRPPVDFDVRTFATELVTPETLTDIRYYIGKIRRIRGDMKSETLYGKQQKLLRFLQKQNVHLGLGHLIAYPDGSFHEKGVDILLAVEMIRLALDGRYDVAYLVSSDTDLVPAVEECIRLGKEVVYVGSSLHGQSFGLSEVCTKTILLQPKDVLPYVPLKQL